MAKQLYYDKTEGFLWYEENGESKFYAWLDDATTEEVESSIDKVAPKEVAKA